MKATYPTVSSALTELDPAGYDSVALLALADKAVKADSAGESSL